MSLGYTLFGQTLPPLPRFGASFPWVGGDLQTIKNNLSWREPAFPAQRQTRMPFAMNDGSGDLLTGLLDKPEREAKLPLLILVHGLTGCEASRNIMTSAAHFVAEEFPTLRLNLRGAGPSLGTCTQHYHAGRTEDLIAVLNELPSDLKSHGIVLVGVSLGGNTILKLVGVGSHTNDVVAVASVCAPIDLKMAQLRIMAPRNRVYHRYLITRMKTDALEGAKEVDKDRIRSTLSVVQTVYDYDDLIVAPNNGFDGAEDYYKQCSATNYYDAIDLPTLSIHSASDPWIPFSMYTDRTWPRDTGRSLVISKDGGHVGFHHRDSDVPWHNLCISTFFKHVLG